MKVILKMFSRSSYESAQQKAEFTTLPRKEDLIVLSEDSRWRVDRVLWINVSEDPAIFELEPQVEIWEIGR